MSRYRKVDPKIWGDEKFRRLPDSAKLLFFALLTHPHLTMLGAMRATLPGLAAEIGWKDEAFREAFGEVLSKGMAKHDAGACLVWLPNFLKYNRPENPNVVKAWGDALDLLPECALKKALIQSCKAFAEGLGEAFAKALPKAFLEDLAKGMAKGMANQEQEQEQKREQKKHSSANSPRKQTVSVTEGSEAFEVAWREYPKRAGGNSKSSAMQAWNARLTQGHSEEEMITGMRRYAAYIRAKGTEGTEYVKQASTFFGRDKHFLELFPPPEPMMGSRIPLPELPVRAGFQ